MLQPQHQAAPGALVGKHRRPPVPQRRMLLAAVAAKIPGKALGKILDKALLGALGKAFGKARGNVRGKPAIGAAEARNLAPAGDAAPAG